jgi:hypothetical protein
MRREAVQCAILRGAAIAPSLTVVSTVGGRRSGARRAPGQGIECARNDAEKAITVHGVDAQDMTHSRHP